MTHGAKVPPGVRRSPKWPAVRLAFLRGKVCAVCGGKRMLEAHHVVPFHVDRALELDVTNLIPLCEGNHFVNCHLLFGHRGNFQNVNSDVRHDAEHWRAKLHGDAPPPHRSGPKE